MYNVFPERPPDRDDRRREGASRTSPSPPPKGADPRPATFSPANWREATPERVGSGRIADRARPIHLREGQVDGGDGRGAPQARLVRGSQTRSPSSTTAEISFS